MNYECNEHQVKRSVEHLPTRWQQALLAKHSKREAAAGSVYSRRIDAYLEHGKARTRMFQYQSAAQSAAQQEANKRLAETLNKLRSIKIELNASDSQVCEKANECASYAYDLANASGGAAKTRAAMEHWCTTCGVEPPPEKIKSTPAILRMSCRFWWRRSLRKLLALAAEESAIILGWVQRYKDCYCSNEALKRRTEQNKRNQLMLENTYIRNQHGQEFTLAEISARGVSNKAVRRAELMTRIAGFELIARESDHAGYFVTLTCPSRMHAYTDAGAGKCFPNKRYDQTSPKDAQAYLCKVWARIRAKLALENISLYGFRIAEPHHDGCPHWHLLLFMARDQVKSVLAAFHRHALKDSPDEPGAQIHRLKIKRINWEHGSAAGYIAKYISKNIDGHGVEKDLLGNDTITSSQRVECWARTWHIRQFQQIGGAPVGVWREMRRIRELPENTSNDIRMAHTAVNLSGVEDESIKHGWKIYTQIQGGIACGRSAKIKLAKEKVEALTQYMEQQKDRIIGVVQVVVEKRRYGIIPDWPMAVAYIVKSVRYLWVRINQKQRRHSWPMPQPLLGLV